MMISLGTDVDPSLVNASLVMEGVPGCRGESSLLEGIAVVSKGINTCHPQDEESVD